ncbi:MAG: fibronectin type III domain-containing protein, partial [Agathobacter sp.]|nr:fibronectin type III domain-containing protein [Agathobacter sp.]
VRDAAGNVIAANNYTVTYSKDLKSVGTKKVKVTFHGAYTGSKTVSYNVVPKNVSSVKVTAKTKSLKVSWKKQTKQTSGYEIYYATNKQFKSAKKIDITKTKTTSRIIKSLKKGNTYYVRIRSYKKVGKKKYYSSWSKTQSVKIKK